MIVIRNNNNDNNNNNNNNNTAVISWHIYRDYPVYRDNLRTD